MKVIALAILIFIGTLSLLSLSLYYLDTHTYNLSGYVSDTLRKGFGYCLDGGKVYYAKKPFVTDGGCRICVCAPELGGVSCKYNTAEPSCIPKVN